MTLSALVWAASGCADAGSGSAAHDPALEQVSAPSLPPRAPAMSIAYGGSGCAGSATQLAEPDGFRVGFTGFELRAARNAPPLTRDCALTASLQGAAGWQWAPSRVAVTGYAILPPGGTLTYGVKPDHKPATPLLRTETVRGEHFGRWNHKERFRDTVWSRCGQAGQVQVALPVTLTGSSDGSSDALVQVRSMFVELAWRRCSS